MEKKKRGKQRRERKEEERRGKEMKKKKSKGQGGSQGELMSTRFVESQGQLYKPCLSFHCEDPGD